MRFSTDVLEKMGFRDARQEELLDVEFHAIHVFAISGLTKNISQAMLFEDTLRGKRFRVVMSDTVNLGCRVMFDGDYSGDEAKWETENKTSGPYLLVHLGPTRKYASTSGWIQVVADEIYTLESFNDAKEELQGISDDVLSTLITGFFCAFSDIDSQPTFRQVDKVVFGTTPDGRTVKDLRFTLDARLSIARNVSKAEIESRATIAMKAMPKVCDKVSRIFSSALDERDSLKKFLFLFLCIERLTHAAFKNADHISATTNHIVGGDPLKVEFFHRYVSSLKSLGDRFRWCSFSIWKSITPSDVDVFMGLKAVRDNIAHGTISAPNESDIIQASRLAVLLIKESAWPDDTTPLPPSSLP